MKGQRRASRGDNAHDEFKLEAGRLVQQLRLSMGKDDADQFAAAEALYDFPGDDIDHRDHALKVTACVESGAIAALIEVAAHGATDDTRAQAFDALGTMCCSEAYSTQVGTAPEFLRAVELAFTGAVSEDLVASVCYLLANVAYDSWESHQAVRRFTPHALQIMRNTSFSKYARSRGVVFIANLSYNDANRSILIAHSVIEPLADVMVSGDMELCCTTSAVALANLVGSHERHPSLSLEDDTANLNRWMVHLFEASLNRREAADGKSTPFADDWKLAQALAKLTQADTNKTDLMKRAVVDLLARAMKLGLSDERLCRHTVRALWHMTFLPQAQAAIAANEHIRKSLHQVLRSQASTGVEREVQALLWQLTDPAEQSQLISDAVANHAAGSVYVACVWEHQAHKPLSRILSELRTSSLQPWMDADQETSLSQHNAGNSNKANAQRNTARARQSVAVQLKAVAGVRAVVVCVSAECKCSPLRRVEIEYARKCGVPVVAVLVESNYRADGWLGDVAGDSVADITHSGFAAQALKSVVARLKGESAAPPAKGGPKVQLRKRTSLSRVSSAHWLSGRGKTPSTVRVLTDKGENGGEGEGEGEGEGQGEGGAHSQAVQSQLHQLQASVQQVRADNSQALANHEAEGRRVRQEVAQLSADLTALRRAMEARAKHGTGRMKQPPQQPQQGNNGDNAGEGEGGEEGEGAWWGQRQSNPLDPSAQSVATMSVQDVGTWLACIGFNHVIEGFKEERVDGKSLLGMSAWPQAMVGMLSERFGLTVGDVTRFLWEVSRLCEGEGRGRGWVRGSHYNHPRSLSPMSKEVMDSFGEKLMRRSRSNAPE